MYKEVKASIYQNTGLCPNTQIYKDITLDHVLEIILDKRLSTKNLAIELVVGRCSLVWGLNKALPNAKLSGSQTWAWWFTCQSDFNYCATCSNYKIKNQFLVNKRNSSGYSTQCKECTNSKLRESGQGCFKSAKRRARKLQAIPPWADYEVIRKIYANCPEGHHVDHIYPLQGENICGLHVENNLQYLKAHDNLVKGNKFMETLQK